MKQNHKDKKAKNGNSKGSGKTSKKDIPAPESVTKTLVSEEQGKKADKGPENKEKDVLVESSTEKANEQIVSSAEDKKGISDDKLHRLLLGTPDLTSVVRTLRNEEEIKKDESYFEVMSKILMEQGKHSTGDLQYKIADRSINLRKYPLTSLREVTVGEVSDRNPLIFEEVIPAINYKDVISLTQIRGYAMQLVKHYGITTPMSLSDPDSVDEISDGIPKRWLKNGLIINDYHAKYRAMKDRNLLEMFNEAVGKMELVDGEEDVIKSTRAILYDGVIQRSMIQAAMNQTLIHTKRLGVVLDAIELPIGTTLRAFKQQDRDKLVYTKRRDMRPGYKLFTYEPRLVFAITLGIVRHVVDVAGVFNSISSNTVTNRINSLANLSVMRSSQITDITSMLTTNKLMDTIVKVIMNCVLDVPFSFMANNSTPTLINYVECLVLLILFPRDRLTKDSVESCILCMYQVAKNTLSHDSNVDVRYNFTGMDWYKGWRSTDATSDFPSSTHSSSGYTIPFGRNDWGVNSVGPTMNDYLSTKFRTFRPNSVSVPGLESVLNDIIGRVNVEVFPGFRLLETIIKTVAVSIPKEWRKIKFDEYLFVSGSELLSLLYLLSDGNAASFDHLILGKAAIDMVDNYTNGMLELSDLALTLINNKATNNTTLNKSIASLTALAEYIDETCGKSDSLDNINLVVRITKRFSRTQSLINLLSTIVEQNAAIDDYNDKILNTMIRFINNDPGTFGITEYVIISSFPVDDDTDNIYDGIFAGDKHPFRKGLNLETTSLDALQHTPIDQLTNRFSRGLKIMTRRRFRVTLGSAQTDIECVNPISTKDGKIIISDLVLRAKLAGMEELDADLHEMLRASRVHIYVNPANMKYYTARSVLQSYPMRFGSSAQSAAPLDIPVEYYGSDLAFGEVLQVPVVDNVVTQ